jgi:hypothetical protein
MQTTNFPDITLTITKNLKIQTATTYKLHAKEYNLIVGTEEATDLKREQRMGFEGEGAAAEKPEGEAATQKRMFEGNIETAVQTTYAVEMPITYEQRRYVNKNARFMGNISEFLARSMILTKEYTAANIINNGFSGGATGYDGQQYFSASHTWRSDGSTYSNLLNAVDLGKDSLETAVTTMVQAARESSIPMMINPTVVQIFYANFFKLPELLKSLLDPESANNTYNALRQLNLKGNLNHYFSDANAYVIDSNVKTRTFYSSINTTFDSYMDNPTKNLIERGLCAFAPLFYDQAGSYGSAGS